MLMIEITIGYIVVAVTVFFFLSYLVKRSEWHEIESDDFMMVLVAALFWPIALAVYAIVTIGDGIIQKWVRWVQK